MVPLLSRKSIVVLSLGLVLGILAGLGYWYISPVNVSFQGKWPPVRIEANFSPAPEVYGSTVVIEPVGQGMYVATKDLQRRAEYWGYKLGSSPFLDFVSEKLAEQSPEYSHTPEELANMTKVKVNYTGPITTVVLTVSSKSEQETQFLAGAIPEFLQQDMISGELGKASENHKNQLLQIEEVEGNLEEAQKELDALTANSTANMTDGISRAPGSAYWNTDLEAKLIAANALVQSLNAEVVSLTNRLTSLISGNSTLEQLQYVTDQLDRVSAALVDARNNQARLQAQKEASLTTIEQASAKVATLSTTLDNLNRQLILLPASAVVENQVRGQFYVHDPSPTFIVPTEKIRGRNAVMMGAVGGLAIAWLGLNFKRLLRRNDESSPEINAPEIDQDRDGEA